MAERGATAQIGGGCDRDNVHARQLARDRAGRQLEAAANGGIESFADEIDGTGPRASGNRQHVAMQRYGTVDEIADFVAYLASPGAGYITGADLKVDGGYTA
jgi:3-oxoacyl-[acyl-carrier protein] reductase